MTFRQRVEYFESDLIREALKLYHGNNVKAARSLQMHRNTLLRLRHKYGFHINRPTWDKSVEKKEP